MLGDTRRSISIWAAIALAAVALRCWHLTTGLDQGFVFPDEMIFHRRIAAFFPLSWASLVPQGPLWAPTFYSTVAGVCALVAQRLGAIGRLTLGTFFSGYLVVARVVSVAASLATVAVTARLGERAFGAATGLLAAALVAVAPVEVMQAHFAAVDTMVVLWMTVASVAALRVADTGTVAAVMLGGVAAGLAFASKYSGLAALVPVAWGIAEHCWRTGAWQRLIPLTLLLVLALVAAAVIACPALVVRSGDVLADIRFLRIANLVGQGQNNVVAASLGWYGRPRLYQLVVGLPFALGFAFYALALAGVAVAALRRSVSDRVLLAAIVPYFVIVTGTRATFHRYLMPVVPPLAVLGARALVAVGARPVRLGIALLVLFHTATYTASLVGRLVPDQEAAVAAWLRDHQPTGARQRIVLPDMLPSYSGLTCFLPAHLAPTPAAFGHWLDERPDVVILPEWVAVLVRRTPPSPEAVRELDRLESGTGGYREALGLPPAWFLHDAVYGRLDPGLRTDWWGRTGFRVFVPTPAAAGG